MNLQLDFHKIIEQLKFIPGDPLLFGSSLFFLLFIFVMGVLFLLRSTPRGRAFFLIAFSVYFYYKSAEMLVLVLIGSAVANYLLGRVLFRVRGRGVKMLALWGGILVNLAVLGYFKYTNFFLEILSSIQGKTFQPLEILLPLGLSYYTFKAISYLLDIYWEAMETEPSFRDFLLYFVFFPNVVLGPIDRATAFIPQIQNDTVSELADRDVGRAIFIIILGMIKKFVIADYIGINFVERIFDSPARFTGVENLLGVYAYALQLYCDFSGYTDMAIGVALLMGFKLMENFNYPYQATSVADFWRRWHMSLSSWLLEYLFRPLQMSMRKLRIIGNILALIITFVLCGLWHGASINFVIWGSIHAFFMAFAVAVKTPKQNLYKLLRIDRIPFLPFLQTFVTFHLIAFAWIFFKAPNLTVVQEMFRQMVEFFKPGVFPQFVGAYPVIFAMIVLGFFIHFLPSKLYYFFEKQFSRFPLPLGAFFLAAAIYLVTQVRFEDLVPFIYFQF